MKIDWEYVWLVLSVITFSIAVAWFGLALLEL